MNEREEKYQLALILVEHIHRRLRAGRVYLTRSGRQLITAGEVIQAILDNELAPMGGRF